MRQRGTVTTRDEIHRMDLFHSQQLTHTYAQWEAGRANALTTRRETGNNVPARWSDGSRPHDLPTHTAGRAARRIPIMLPSQSDGSRFGTALDPPSLLGQARLAFWPTVRSGSRRPHQPVANEPVHCCSPGTDATTGSRDTPLTVLFLMSLTRQLCRKLNYATPKH